MSAARRFRRILSGQHNDCPTSTKVSKHTEASKGETRGPGYRKGRFNTPKPLILSNGKIFRGLHKRSLRPALISK